MRHATLLPRSSGNAASEHAGAVDLTVEPDTAAEAKTLFSALSAGGSTEMPLQATQWAELYGICADKFGVQWMVNYTGAVTCGPA
jgi:PhnB protein